MYGQCIPHLPDAGICSSFDAAKIVPEPRTQDIIKPTGPGCVAGITQKPESAGWRGDQPRPPVGRDKTEKPQGIADLLPDWVGYGFLYGLSGLPVIIGVLVVAVLFFNSLK